MWIGLNVIYEIKNRTFTISFVLVGVIYIFLNKSKELFDKLGESRVMCLATSENNRVTARSMSFILYENKFYFQTDRRFLKHQQIRSNPNVAICYSNIQIEGVCKEMGHHPLLGANDFFACKYKQHYASSYEKYMHMDNEVLFEIDPVLISVWDYDDGKPYQEFFAFTMHTYRKTFYN